MTKPPYVVGGLALLAGYVWCWVNRQRAAGLARVDDAFTATSRWRGLKEIAAAPAARRRAAEPVDTMTTLDRHGRLATRRLSQRRPCQGPAGARPVRRPAVATPSSCTAGSLAKLQPRRRVVRGHRRPAGLGAGARATADRTPDLLTFWQRMPEMQAPLRVPHEWEELAVLPDRVYEHWWKNQIKSRVRNQIRKAAKDGLVVREVPYDDDFVRGMTAIFNESPVRQGRPFWHYGKEFETVKPSSRASSTANA